MNNLISSSISALKEKKIPNPELDIRILLKHSSHNDKDIILSNMNIDDIDINFFKSLLLKRLNNEPISKIVNKKYFWKDEFFVNFDVLDPRPETELIIEEALNNVNRNKKLDILDIGTGSGCLAISLAKEFPNAKIIAIDISRKALNVAKYNAKLHQLENRIKFYKSSVDNFFKGNYDLIISNPPYVNQFYLKYLEKDVIGFEPNLALKGGIDGFTILKRVIKKSSRLLKIGGKLILEIGFDQKLKVSELLKKEKYFVNKIVKDYGNRDRCVICTKL